ncbi:MAG: ATP-binding cassette domain-containing protein, partial [Actinobacteria bacterium]|nr:ATP-binding cassette domain-containing protein [Actinomycetota bacterium]
FELHRAAIKAGEKIVLSGVDWNVGPGDRIGIIGVNGSGKTTLMRSLTGDNKPSAGKLVTGVTVKLAFLSQHLEELDPTWRVLEAVEKIANQVQLGNGKELTASQLCERLGFTADTQWTPVGDLSGGERRRLQLTRLLMDGPNVLLLDEPTNDFDVETLTALEDLLDSFGGTLVVISHDRYFLERVCDRFVGLLDDLAIRDLPGGVDEYLELRSNSISQNKESGEKSKVSTVAQVQLLKKEIAKLEKQLMKIDAENLRLQKEQVELAFDHEKLSAVMKELADVEDRKSEIEEQWLSATSNLEGLTN